MKCPQCGEEMQIPWHARKNMDSYGNAVTVSVDCCHKAVHIIPRVCYEAVKVIEVEEDDWGDACK